MNPDVIVSKDMIVGEIEYKGIEITRSDDASFVINSGTYQVFDGDNNPLTEILPATVSGNTVYGKVRTSDFIGKNHVDFTYYIDSEGIIKKARLIYNVI